MKKMADFIVKYWHLLVAAVAIIFGWANFASETTANAKDITRVEKRLDKFEDKIDVLIKITERIDERTKPTRR